MFFFMVFDFFRDGLFVVVRKSGFFCSGVIHWARGISRMSPAFTSGSPLAVLVELAKVQMAIMRS
jgi:hypothetical protein